MNDLLKLAQRLSQLGLEKEASTLNRFVKTSGMKRNMEYLVDVSAISEKTFGNYCATKGCSASDSFARAKQMLNSDSFDDMPKTKSNIMRAINKIELEDAGDSEED